VGPHEENKHRELLQHCIAQRGFCAASAGDAAAKTFGAC
jgi:hypothetical protein